MTAFPSRVLLVEDDAVLGLASEQALREAGAREVIWCSSTDEAIRALRARRYDALVLDVHLADRDDGWAIAELVVEVSARRPRIVFSTGSPQDIPPGIAALGVILEKPYEPAALIAALSAPPRAGPFSWLRRGPAA